MVKWIKKHCVVCGKNFQCPDGGGYQPKTCNDFDCTQKFARHPERYISFHQYVDDCRMRAGI